MKHIVNTILLLVGVIWIPSKADVGPFNPPHVTDNFDISIGPNDDVCLGDPQYFVPIGVSFSAPIVEIDLILAYDQTLITPTLLAPNIFFQGFYYDLSIPGRIKIDLITDLPPPPVVPPILGDTIIAWISFHVTSRDLLFNMPTHITYYEDPITPYPDNYVVKENLDRISSPYISLHQGDLLLKHPLYGDINLNGYPYEIADGVMFGNFFSGAVHFNRCQYANSDCNRDGFQATIADLVYFLRILSGDSIRAFAQMNMPPGDPVWRPSAGAIESQPLFPSGKGYDIMVQSNKPLGGASFDINLSDNSQALDEVILDPAAAYMQMYCYIDGNTLKVTVVNWDGSNSSFSSGRLLMLHFSGSFGSPPFKIDSADFSDNDGQMITANYSLGGAEPQGSIVESEIEMALSGSPNPFKGTTAISYSLINNGQYQLAVYDILGRKVKTLLNGYRPAGAAQITWDGHDEAGDEIASGTYFVRLQGGGKSRTTKLFFLK